MKQMIAFLLSLAFALSLTSYSATHYDRQATVTSLNDVVYVTDNQGFVWSFEGDGYKVGDKITLKMYNNNTDNIITDDEIIGVE